MSYLIGSVLMVIGAALHYFIFTEAEVSHSKWLLLVFWGIWVIGLALLLLSKRFIIGAVFCILSAMLLIYLHSFAGIMFILSALVLLYFKFKQV
ncbi:MAG: hypothetical protein ACETWM_13770 [Candidatus Lokiarchaeia archaeon]